MEVQALNALPPSPPALVIHHEDQLPPATCIGTVLFPVAVPPAHNRSFWIVHSGIKAICQGPVDELLVHVQLQLKVKRGWLPMSEGTGRIVDPPLPGRNYRVTDTAVCSKFAIATHRRREWRLRYRVTIESAGRVRSGVQFSPGYLIVC